MAEPDDLSYQPPPAAPPASPAEQPAEAQEGGQAAPPSRGGLRLIAIGLVVVVIALLALRVLVLATVGAVAPKPPPRAQEAPAATATPTVEPPAFTEPELDPATAAAGNACPEGVAPPDGVPVGWLARVAGCSDIALATLDGVRQWVRRDRLDDDIYYQLPEVTP